jgi:hypothetical protein
MTVPVNAVCRILSTAGHCALGALLAWRTASGGGESSTRGLKRGRFDVDWSLTAIEVRLRWWASRAPKLDGDPTLALTRRGRGTNSSLTREPLPPTPLEAVPHGRVRSGLP